MISIAQDLFDSIRPQLPVPIDCLPWAQLNVFFNDQINRHLLYQLIEEDVNE
jgi:hypothetical protein